MIARPVLKPLRRPWLWLGLWCAAIVMLIVASLLPAVDLPQAPPGSDKLEHFFAYCALAVAAVQLFMARAVVRIALGLVLLGVGMEIAQFLLTSTRTMDGWDALANTLGVLAGLGSVLMPWRDALLRFDRRG